MTATATPLAPGEPGSPQLELWRGRVRTIAAAVAFTGMVAALSHELLSERFGLAADGAWGRLDAVIALVLGSLALFSLAADRADTRARPARGTALAALIAAVFLMSGARLAISRTPAVAGTLESAVGSGAALALLALAILALDGGRARIREAGTALATLVLLLAEASGMAHALAAGPLPEHMPILGPVEALGLAMLALGALCARPTPAVERVLSARDSAAWAFRARLAWAVVLPPVLTAGIYWSMRPENTVAPVAAGMWSLISTVAAVTAVVGTERAQRRLAEGELETRDALARQQHRGAFLREVGDALTAARSREDGLGRCSELVRLHLGARHVRIWAFDRTAGTPVLAADAGAPAPPRDAAPVVPPARPAGSTGLPAPWLTDDLASCLSSAERGWARTQGVVAVAGLPLLIGERAFGVIELFADRRLDRDDLHALTSIAHDIALALQRDLAEGARLETERRAHAILDCAPDALLLLDAQGVVTGSNRAAEGLFEHGRLGTHGRPFGDLVRRDSDHDDAPLDRATLTAVAASGERLAAHLRHGDGPPIPVEVAIGTVPASAGSGYAAFLHDLRPRRVLEDQLRQSQRMEALGRLAGGIAHDFNNLLTVIQGYAVIARERLGANDPGARYADEIEGAARRAAELTRQLLAFSRRQVLEPRVLDPRESLFALERMLRRLIGEDLRLVIRCAQPLGRVRVDPGQFDQVVVNLVVNARDAMPHGGTIEIECVDAEPGTGDVSAGDGTPATPHVMLSVSDTGTGMDEAALARVFEPFFTTKDPGRGTGLGLSTVYGIVRQSGGTITVRSAPGQGTTFCVRLPRVVDPLPAETPAPPPAARLADGDERVLLVEDDDSVRRVAADMLRELGYEVIESDGGEDALRRWNEAAANIDLVITDVVMPRMSGRDLADRLAARTPSVRLVYMSGYTADVPEVLDIGAGGHFLQKPFTLEQLATRVREALDRPPVEGPGPRATVTNGHATATANGRVVAAAVGPNPRRHRQEHPR